LEPLCVGQVRICDAVECRTQEVVKYDKSCVVSWWRTAQ